MGKRADPRQHVQRPSRHPEHDAVAHEVSGWYTSSAPEIGYQVTAHWYGYQSDLSAARSRVIVRVDEPDQVRAALADARAVGRRRQLTIWVDARDRAARLDAALRRSGCQRGDATTHLALTGPMTVSRGPRHLAIHSVVDAGLEEWATVKLQSFGDAESAPAPARLAEEVAIRRRDVAIAECQVGVVGGAVAAVLAYYRGHDQMVFILGTRVPYRHQGIAQAMLARWAATGTADGCRSLLINATEGGRPAELYRRIGFVDEVYWYQSYDLVS